jgi:hypothetical protein
MQGLNSLGQAPGRRFGLSGTFIQNGPSDGDRALAWAVPQEPGLKWPQHVHRDTLCSILKETGECLTLESHTVVLPIINPAERRMMTALVAINAGVSTLQRHTVMLPTPATLEKLKGHVACDSSQQKLEPMTREMVMFYEGRKVRTWAAAGAALGQVFHALWAVEVLACMCGTAIRLARCMCAL